MTVFTNIWLLPVSPSDRKWNFDLYLKSSLKYPWFYPLLEWNHFRIFMFKNSLLSPISEFLTKNEKKSLKSDKNFLKLLFLKLSDNFKVGRRLKYRYPVNRIIWILRVSYNHMIIVAQNIKKIATVSSSKLHE